MFDYREYLIAIAAVFLSLALGILIGITFGEDFLVYSQREIIEMLEDERGRLRELVTEREEEVERWEAMKPLLKARYEGALKNRSIALVSGTEEDSDFLLELFDNTGADLTAVLLPEQVLNKTTKKLSDLLAGGDIELLQLNAGAHLLLEGEPVWPPDLFVVIHPGEGIKAGHFFTELWKELHLEGNRVIGVAPWVQQEEVPELLQAEDICFVDNINTFWGQVAFLEIIVFDLDGHFGFGSEQGLVPFKPGVP